MSHEKGKIIDFKKAKNARSLTPMNQKLMCKHRSVLVDADKRQLECETCGALIDAFEYVFSIALREESSFEKMKSYEADVELLKREKVRLEEEILKLRSQKRRIA